MLVLIYDSGNFGSEWEIAETSKNKADLIKNILSGNYSGKPILTHYDIYKNAIGLIDKVDFSIDLCEL